MLKTISALKIIDLLDNASARGFCSEPVPSRWSTPKNQYTEQHCNFTEEEKKQVQQFMAENIKVLRSTDYPINGIWGNEPNRRTISLLGMLNYMLSNNGDSPEYVATQSKHIEDILDQLENIEDIK